MDPFDGKNTYWNYNSPGGRVTITCLPVNFGEWPFRLQLFFTKYAAYYARTVLKQQGVSDSWIPWWMEDGLSQWPSEPRRFARLVADWAISRGYVQRPPLGRHPGDEVLTVVNDLLTALWKAKLESEAAERKAKQFTPQAAFADLRMWVSSGVTKASALSARLANEYGLTMNAAEKHRKALGFVPAYKGGPVVIPKEAQQWQH